MWIDRQLSGQVLAAARQFPALVVTGGRQTGKTTLLRHLFPAASFASLDLPSAAFQADESGEQFLRSYQEPKRASPFGGATGDDALDVKKAGGWHGSEAPAGQGWWAYPNARSRSRVSRSTVGAGSA